MVFNNFDRTLHDIFTNDITDIHQLQWFILIWFHQIPAHMVPGEPGLKGGRPCGRGGWSRCLRTGLLGSKKRALTPRDQVLHRGICLICCNVILPYMHPDIKYIYIGIHIHMYVCTYWYVCMHKCMYVDREREIYIYIYTNMNMYMIMPSTNWSIYPLAHRLYYSWENYL